MVNETSIESLLRRDRTIVLVGLIGIAALSWIYTVDMEWQMTALDTHMKVAVPQMQVWGMADLVMVFVMWAVMMAAMMVPSATPVVLTFAAINRKRLEQQQPYVPTSVFLLGYLIVWTGFSLAVTLIQWGLHAAALLSPMMVSTSPIFGSVLLLAAGIFQWTPLKRACLVHCRSPLDFIVKDWHNGISGALWMGLKHGSYCLGCCWILMALLFVAGVMNLLLVAAIAIFILLEKILPQGDLVRRVAGGVLVLMGFLLLVQT